MDMQKIHGLSVEDKIGLAAVAVLGKGVAEAAFLLAHPNVTTSNKSSMSVMVSRWHHSPAAIAFIKSVQAGTAALHDDDTSHDLTTRTGLIDQLVTATKQTQGKDSITGLTALAKLQGFDRPEEHPNQEMRRFYIAYKSDCRRCKLMELYRGLMKEKGIST